MGKSSVNLSMSYGWRKNFKFFKMKNMKTYRLPEETLTGTEFYNCRFEGGSFAESNGQVYEFHDCEFCGSDFSSAKIDGFIFDKIRFEHCRFTGVSFSYVNHFLFDASFTLCMLDYAVFEKNNLKNTVFTECSLKEACFFECGLKGAKFTECDMTGTLFERSDIENADFTTARNYFIDLDKNKVKGAKFSLPEAANLLMKYKIKIV